jgi:hypothetical protein
LPLLGHPIPSEIAVHEKPAPHKQSGLLISEAVERPAFLRFSTPHLFSARDNPASTPVIRSLILLGARRDARDLSQDRDLPPDASAVRYRYLAAD